MIGLVGYKRTKMTWVCSEQLGAVILKVNQKDVHYGWAGEGSCLDVDVSRLAVVRAVESTRSGESGSGETCDLRPSLSSTSPTPGSFSKLLRRTGWGAGCSPLVWSLSIPLPAGVAGVGHLMVRPSSAPGPSLSPCLWPGLGMSADSAHCSAAVSSRCFRMLGPGLQQIRVQRGDEARGMPSH